MTEPLLVVDDLSVRYRSGTRPSVRAVEGVSFEVRPGEIVALVGESGCGKSTTALAIMGLLPDAAAVTGRIAVDGRDLVGLPEDDLRALRGGRIGMVFQDPLTSLDPSFAIGDQIAATVRAHGGSKADARRRAMELLAEVGIPAPDQRYGDPPHRFSGGMRQRVVIAAAIANNPALLLADEPTTALDVTIQAQILSLLRALRDTHGTGILLIAHDLGVVAQLADRVGVMYAGQLVETASVAAIFASPRHPYTRALLAAQPTAAQRAGTLQVIEGQVPDLGAPPPGCRFAPRCPLVHDRCSLLPPLADDGLGHGVACWATDQTRRAAAAGGGAIDATLRAGTGGAA
jgi:oligopeptide/dipeptide ABC transporter ATP-binding protein